MKTTITIENGRVSVQVDDDQPVQVQTSPPANTNRGEKPHLPGLVADEKLLADPKPQVVAKPKLQEKSAASKPDVQRACMICGDDISSLDRRRKLCKKPECEKEQKKRYQAAWLKKRQGTVQPEQAEPEKKVEWCKHCQAYVTDHASATHADWTMKDWKANATVAESVPHVQRDVAADGFPDPWNCEACRRRSHLCPLHQSMADDGKEPPKIKGRAPGTMHP